MILLANKCDDNKPVVKSTDLDVVSESLPPTKLAYFFFFYSVRAEVRVLELALGLGAHG